MAENESLLSILSRIKSDLEITFLAEGIRRFGGHPLRVILKSGEVDFWSEFIRVELGKNRTLVFRVITRISDHTERNTYILRGVRFLVDKATINPRVFIIDNRSNLERELEPGTTESGSFQSDDVKRMYDQLLKGEVDLILTPIREGALGPTEVIGNVGPFSERSAKNDPKVWDILEEIQVAQLVLLALSGRDSSRVLTLLRSRISNQYIEFALPLAKILGGHIDLMKLRELPESISQMTVDLNFFSDQVISKDIDLGFGSKKVEQVIAYPYPTQHGIIYVRLFRVWNVQRTEFELVRVLQTRSSLTTIDGIRIDSSCVDGVHNLDCHCDCKAQLEQALYERGLKIGKNVVVIQMADHEGKNWGSVLKGAGTHRPVREFNQLNPDRPIDHVDVAAQFYNALGVTPDNRNYGAAQAVVLFLGILDVESMLMDNNEKIKSLEAVGLIYKRKQTLYPDESQLTEEANRVNIAKKSGKVRGINGNQIIYDGKEE